MTRKYTILTLVIVSLTTLATALLLPMGAVDAQTNTETAAVFHPAYPLLDADGANVLDSGEAISTMTTCGACHDTAFIAAHSVHVDAGAVTIGTVTVEGRPWQTGVGWYGGWNPISYVQPSEMDVSDWLRDYGWRHVGGGPAAEAGMEMDCFVCHTPNADGTARNAALADEQFAWVSTATLAGTGVVTVEGAGYVYQPDAFNADGEVLPSVLTLADPTDTNCATCHGVAAHDTGEPFVFDPTAPDQWHTATTGQVFAPERISNSGMNVDDKPAQARSWDIHAERVVGCTDCHYALNNPVFAGQGGDSDPAHLQFDPRRVDSSDYLARPLHQFANGGGDYAAAFPVFEGAVRDCASCHDALSTHDWLPYAEQHTQSMACETCHVPRLHAPALAAIDWTSVDADAQPIRDYRGIDESGTLPLLTGYEPVILTDNDGKLAPYNVVSAWYWVTDDAPVPAGAVREAYYDGRTLHDDVLATFDGDGDGDLSDTERVLDNEDKVSLIASRLADLGYADAAIVAETEAYPIHHGVSNGRWATRDCATCHQSDSRFAAPIMLASNTPGGVTPKLVDGTVAGMVDLAADGTLTLLPEAAPPGELYVFGYHSVALIDWIGIGVMLATVLGVGGHAGLRVMAARRGHRHHAEATQEVYMYSIYERQWHWLQAAVIFGLLFTGIVIHKPEVFPLFQFRWLVLLHNAFAVILIVNAALALFYHVASGEIKQYLPQPSGFFGGIFAQARYYAWGIFRGEPHPFEKTQNRKLNPIQQLTYLGLLNVLLPLQVITGTLMWAAGRFPGVVEAAGGLPFLAPFHTLISWLMAAFIVVHVYMTTTGHTPMANIKAMMLGWDEVEVSGTVPAEAGD